MSNPETYCEKARECVRAADEVHNSSERVELLGLASVYMALADYVDRGRTAQWTAAIKIKICKRTAKSARTDKTGKVCKLHRR